MVRFYRVFTTFLLQCVECNFLIRESECEVWKLLSDCNMVYTIERGREMDPCTVFT